MVAEISLFFSRSSPASPDDRAGRARVAEEVAREDAALVSRCNAGDDDAFDTIIARHRDRLATFAYSILRNHADAEEIAQDTLIRAHRNLAGFRGDCSLASWLRTIALNLSRNRYWYAFRRRHHVTLSLDSPVSEDSAATFADLAASNAPDPAREATTREFSAEVAACIAKLSPCHREILDWLILRSNSYDQIAAGLGISLGTVKSRIARAREKLRALLESTEPEIAGERTLGLRFDPVRPAGGLRYA